MSITLSQCFDETQVKNQLMTTFNGINTVNPLTDAEATAITTLIKLGLGIMVNCDTIYPTVTDGKTAINSYVELNTFPLVVELRSQIFALDNDMGKEHTQAKFNPIDNDSIEKGVIATDDVRFNYAENMLTNVDFLIKNNKALHNLLSYIQRDCYLVF